MDIFEIHERSGEILRDTQKRIETAVAGYEDKVDMALLLQVVEDLLAYKFTTGDIAAVHTYRLGKRRGAP